MKMKRYEPGQNRELDVRVLVSECQRLGLRPIVIELSLLQWYLVAGALQLAQRHPSMSAQQRRLLRKATGEIVEAVGQWSPALAAQLEQGFERRNDV